MDSDSSSRAEANDAAGQGGDDQLEGQNSTAPAPVPAAVVNSRRVPRGRGAGRIVKSSRGPGVPPSSTACPGRVLRNRVTRGTAAGKSVEESSSGNSGRTAACSRRRSRNAVPRFDSPGEVGDESGLVDSENKKDVSSVKASPASRPWRTCRPKALPQPRGPSTRNSRLASSPVCKSEPDVEPPCEDEADKERGDRAEFSDEDDAMQTGEEDAPFVDDLADQNYLPDLDSEEASEEDYPFRDDLNDQSYEPQAKRATMKPRRRVPRLKEKKEKEGDREKEEERDIKMEGEEQVNVKLESDFRDSAEAPRKRGRRRKDDKSPRLPKRRKKPPVQYVRCEMEGCGTVLAHPRYLQHHIKYQHLLKKKYVCPHPSCGRLFRLQKQLLRHAKHHTDQRDYICEYCARAFKSSHNLAVHRMIHTGEKPLQCEICGFTCRQKASLNWHMKKHDADTFYQFSCSICGKKFEKKDSVVAHKAKSHPEVLIAEALAANAGALITTPAPLLPGDGGVPQPPEAEQVEHVVVLSQGTSLHTLQVPMSLTLTLPPGPPQPQLELLPTATPPVPRHTQDLLELDCPISNVPSSSAPPLPTPTGNTSLEPQTAPTGEGGMMWDREGHDHVLLEGPEERSLPQNHHTLL
ncbi:E3 ubiquitin-protein ligase ZFP91-like isoform X2 [Scleropages formosus]|uniref:E3 ubiquitin-protein ligase ZFP91-like isoform X2 n=1 Tax=Scleropages formosus TaxID=113540 RepID=UPI0010FAC050|nr:E3 ubiquitin-protein ligase ZFP91-like isoform X2 [Scleropages formosus]